MAGYDPKRPRPRADDDAPAPVDALLGDEGETDDVGSPTTAADAGRAGPTDSGSAADAGGAGGGQGDETAPAPAEQDQMATGEAAGAEGGGADLEVDLRDVGASGPGGTGRPGRRPEVPVADAPEEGTTNRAVLVAVVVGLVAAAVAVAALVLARRRTD